MGTESDTYVAMFLTPAEVESLTGRQRHTFQVRALQQMGIDHKVRPDGSVAILRAALEACFGCPRPSRTKSTQPNWGALPPVHSPNSRVANDCKPSRMAQP